MEVSADRQMSQSLLVLGAQRLGPLGLVYIPDWWLWLGLRLTAVQSIVVTYEYGGL